MDLEALQIVAPFLADHDGAKQKRRRYQRRSSAPTRGTGPLRLALAGATRSGSAGVGSPSSRSIGEATPHPSGVNWNEINFRPATITHRDIRSIGLADRIQARANGGRKIPPVSGPTGLRGHRRSSPLGCPKLLWRPSQLTRGDGVRQSNRSVWSGFRPDMSEGAWQWPSSCVLGVHSIGWFMPLIAQHRLGAHCGWSAWRGGRCPPRTPLVAEHCKGSERYGHLNDDRAEREQPEFSLGLRIHGSPNAQRHGSFQGSRIWRASRASAAGEGGHCQFFATSLAGGLRSKIPVCSTTRAKSAIVFSLMIDCAGCRGCQIFGRLRPIRIFRKRGAMAPIKRQGVSGTNVAHFIRLSPKVGQQRADCFEFSVGEISNGSLGWAAMKKQFQ
jgi:hypothetical protein